jgi:hypothetical protein
MGCGFDPKDRREPPAVLPNFGGSLPDDGFCETLAHAVGAAFL